MSIWTYLTNSQREREKERERERDVLEECRAETQYKFISCRDAALVQVQPGRVLGSGTERQPALCACTCVVISAYTS